MDLRKGECTYVKNAAVRFCLGLLVVGFFSAGMVGGMGCAREGEDKVPTLHLAKPDDVKSFDPAVAYDQISLDLLPSVYETLYQFEYFSPTYKLVPLLAADQPTFSKDGLIVKIPIRRDVTFQDDKCFSSDTNKDGKGRRVVAQDFITAWKRLAVPSIQSGGYWIFDGKIKGFSEFKDRLTKAAAGDREKIFAEPVEGMKALDENTIQIQLTKPYPQLLFVLAMSFAAPVAHEAMSMYSDDRNQMTDHAVGTGPYRLKSWERNRKIVFDKNPTYHPDFYPTSGAEEYRNKGFLEDSGRRLPLSDRIVVSIIKEQQPTWLHFLSSDLDLAVVPKDNLPSVVVKQTNLTPELAKKGIRLDVESGVTSYWIAFNTRDPLFKSNKLLRQAIASLINREQWIDIIASGMGSKMVHALPKGLQDRATDPNKLKIKYDFNLARGKELLKKAGYPDGKGLPVLSLDLRGADSANRQLGELFASQFKLAGIQLNVIYNTFPAFLEKIKQGNVQMTYGGWMLDYPDAENMYQLFYGPNQAPGPNEANYNVPEMNKLYEKLATLQPGPARAAIIQQIEDHVQEEVPWAYGYYANAYRVTQPWVHNYRGSDIILNKYKYVRVDLEAKKRYKTAQK